MSAAAGQPTSPKESLASDVEFVNYEDESQLAAVMELVLQDLSEPYSSKLNAAKLLFCFLRNIPNTELIDFILCFSSPWFYLVLYVCCTSLHISLLSAPISKVVYHCNQ
jgi:hypothetical protein